MTPPKQIDGAFVIRSRNYFTESAPALQAMAS
jgi:hypothetical protein